MIIKPKTRPRFNKNRLNIEATRDMVKLQNTQYDSDKVAFNFFEYAENMVHDKRNAKVRGGTNNLVKIEDSLGIGFYETTTENKLMSAVDTGTDSKLVEIDRTAGTTSDKITGITGDGDASFTTLGNVFYMANGETDLVEWDGTNDFTVALPSGKPRLITSDEGRVWAEADGLLYFSAKPASGRVTSFAISGSGLERAGIATSAITKFEAIEGSSKYVVACGNGLVEGHRLVEASDGLDTFPADLSTLRWTANEIPASGKDCIKIIGNYVYIKGTDDVLYRIKLSSGAVKIIEGNIGQFEKYDFTNNALGYDQRINMLYIGIGNTCFAYDLKEENFAIYPNLLPTQFIGDESNVYYRQSDGTIIDAFDRDTVTDEGRPINWKIRTGTSYAGSQEMLKDPDRIYLNARAWEDIDVLYSFIADKGIDSLNTNPSWTKTFSLSGTGEPIDGLIGGLDTGMWGGAGFSYSGIEETVETIKNEDVIDSELFERAKLELSGASSNKFSLRGIGFYATITSKPVYDKTYN